MKIKVNGASNWDVTDKTCIKTVKLQLQKWIVCLWKWWNHKTSESGTTNLQIFKKETYRTWIQVTEERYSTWPGRSWIFLVSLDVFAMASHSCCTLCECFCFL